MEDKKPVTIHDLYPEFSPEQLEEADANLRRYLAALLRMAERLASEGRSINDLVDCPFDSDGDHRYHPNAAESGATLSINPSTER